MTIDLAWLGYGSGLVMSGWVCGMVVSVIFSCLGKMR